MSVFDLELQPYQKEIHEPMIRSWLKAYELPESFAEELPRFGLVVLHQKIELIAMAFLRLIEGCKTAMLDGLIVNPFAPLKLKNKAIDDLIIALERKARALGLTQMIANTTYSGVLKRALKHDYIRLPHTMICKNLVQGESI